MTTAKRLMDVSLTLCGLALLWPVMLLIALAIRLEDGGPALFGQQRAGRHGTLFTMWKFRTMSAEADQGASMLTLDRDPRITRIGRRLRSTRLDELPQLFNVLAGDMTLVGPRPEVPCHVAHYSQEQLRSLDWVPGITDPATLRFADQEQILAAAPDPLDMYLGVIMPARMRVAIDYAERATIMSDLLVIARTLRQIWWKPWTGIRPSR